jgi:uncharacterized membrane protein YwaF
MIIGLVILNISAIVIASTVIYKYLKKQISGKTFIVFSFYALINSLFGFALIWHDPLIQYSPLHLVSVTFFIYSGFILLYAKEHRKVIMWGFFVFYVIFNLLRIPYLWIYDGYTIYSILPLHICGISSLFIVARPFYLKSKNRIIAALGKLLDNYLICFAFLGALLNVFLPPVHGFGLDFFNLRTFVSNFIHWSFFTASIYYLLSGEIRPNKKMSVLNLIWLVPAYIMFIFLNSFFASNFFFTNRDGNPIQFLYDLFPMWDWNLGNTIIEVNPIYWIIIVVGAILTLLITTSLFELISKKLLRDKREE